MKKYRLTIYVHLLNALIIILGVLSYFDKSLGLRYIDVIPIFIVVFATFNQINILFVCSIVFEDGITQKSLIRKITIPWDEIRYIKVQPSNILVKTSICIFSSNKKINITSWTKGYKELLRLTIAKSNSNGSMKIDPLVLEKIKNF